MERNDRILAATKHYIANKSAIEVLQKKFDLCIQDASNVVIEGKKMIQEHSLNFWNNPEDQIKGMDASYNPERDINWSKVELKY